MRKSVVLLCASVLLTSCVLVSSDGPSVTSGSLGVYAAGVFEKAVKSPFVIVSNAVLLNEYLHATDEERQDPRFDLLRANLFHVSDDIISIRGIGEFHVTGNLDEPGTEWAFDTDRGKVCRADDGWMYVPAKLEDYGLKAIDAVFSKSGNDGGWLADVSGRTLDAGDLYSEFSVSENFGISWSCIVGEYDTYYDVGCIGSFILDITDGTDRIDWCRMEWFADGGREVVTSR